MSFNHALEGVARFKFLNLETILNYVTTLRTIAFNGKLLKNYKRMMFQAIEWVNLQYVTLFMKYQTQPLDLALIHKSH